VADARTDVFGREAERSGLTREELERYSRHILLPEISVQGQEKLKRASVLCIGAGGLGSPLAMYLAAAGVGTIGLVDFDKVDLTNLQRQVIHGTRNVGQSKLLSAKARIEDINPNVQVELFDLRISPENALDIISRYDVIVDGSDNFATRYLINDACVILNKPNVYGSVFRFEGQLSVFWARRGPCYRCLYPDPPPQGLLPNCSEGGVLGVLPGMVGVMQATEALKLILEIGEPKIGRLIIFDALLMAFKEVKVRRNPDCRVCGDDPTITSLVEYAASCNPESERDVVCQTPSNEEIGPRELRDWLDRAVNLFLLDVRDQLESAICSIPSSKQIPLSELPSRLHEVPTNAEIVVYCKAGTRSAQAKKLLSDAGFTKVRSLAGGIRNWAEQVDPDMPKF
jgi:molybdopterin/thiamine biosynthesis adenylyltransferase/rhodanese-related sulfurtransferase